MRRLRSWISGHRLGVRLFWVSFLSTSLFFGFFFFWTLNQVQLLLSSRLTDSSRSVLERVNFALNADFETYRNVMFYFRSTGRLSERAFSDETVDFLQRYSLLLPAGVRTIFVVHPDGYYVANNNALAQAFRARLTPLVLEGPTGPLNRLGVSEPYTSAVSGPVVAFYYTFRVTQDPMRIVIETDVEMTVNRLLNLIDANDGSLLVTSPRGAALGVLDNLGLIS